MRFKAGVIELTEGLKNNKKLCWFIMEFLSIRYLHEKITPPPISITSNPDYRSPSSILIWIIGIYVAVFGLASQRYENRVDVVENRTNAIITQLANSEMQYQAISRVAKAQNLYVPVQPSFMRPDRVINAFFFEPSQFHQDTVTLLRDSLVSFRKYKIDKKYLLSKKDLSNIQLQGANLEGGHFTGATLDNANLFGADLLNVRFDGASLKNVVMGKTVIRSTNFQNADLRGATGLTPEMICKASNLSGIKLDNELDIKSRKQCQIKFESINEKMANKPINSEVRHYVSR